MCEKTNPYVGGMQAIEQLQGVAQKASRLTTDHELVGLIRQRLDQLEEVVKRAAASGLSVEIRTSGPAGIVLRLGEGPFRVRATRMTRVEIEG